MTESQIALFIAGAMAGGFINGMAGFGTALFALGFWLQFMEPQRAVSTVVILSVVTGLQGLWVVRYAVLTHPRRLARFVVPGVVGIPLGLACLTMISAGTLKIAIAAMMMLYGGYFITRRSLPRFESPTPIGDMLVGLIGGAMGGAAAVCGAVPTMWCALRPWTKAETRAVLQPFNVAILGLSAISFAALGYYDTDTIWMVAVALPAAMLAAQLGILTFRRLSDTQFQRLIILMMLISGSVLMARALA